jgi:hypothetical protein
MTLNNDSIFDTVSDSPGQSLLDKECSDLMIKIHSVLDLKNAPIKTIVQALGVTPTHKLCLLLNKLTDEHHATATHNTSQNMAPTASFRYG